MVSYSSMGLKLISTGAIVRPSNGPLFDITMDFVPYLYYSLHIFSIRINVTGRYMQNLKISISK